MGLYLLKANGQLSNKETDKVGLALLDEVYRNYEIPSENFKTQAKIDLQLPHQKTIFVQQRELAVVRNDGSITHVGSDEATTCHIMILRQPDTGFTTVGHIDSIRHAQLQANQQIQMTIESNEPSAEKRFDAFIVGGFNEMHYSTKISIAILTSLANQRQAIFCLRIACISKLNNMKKDGYDVPAICSLAIDVKSGNVVIPNFKDVEPERQLRKLRHTYSDEHWLLPITDQSKNFISIPPFSYIARMSAEIVEFWINQPDDFILMHMSTSPKAENAHFCDNVRKTLKFLLENPDCTKMFSENKPLRYNVRDCEWVKLEE